jgi:hypothetical protein
MMERYTHGEIAVLMYHLHIPMPDPMTNPSTEARADFYQAKATPTFAIDGQLGVGGGSRDETQEYYDKLNSQVEERLGKPAEARLLVNASLKGEKVDAKASVDGIKNRSPDLRLQIALVEGQLSYSGEGGLRFHPMVVRSLGRKAGGFALNPSGPTKVSMLFIFLKYPEIKRHLEDMEKDRKMTFRGRMWLTGKSCRWLHLFRLKTKSH